MIKWAYKDEKLSPMSFENSFRFLNHWNILLIQKVKIFMKNKRKRRKEHITGLMQELPGALHPLSST